MSTRIYLFRHGETDWNAEGRFQGHLDIPLNDRGREQARGLVPALRAGGVQAIVSSDLTRALETARIVAAALGVPVHEDARLREAHLGGAQGLTVSEIMARFGQEALSRWKSNHPTDADVSYPGGETGAAVLQRALEALNALVKSGPVRCWGLSTHGGIIRRLMHHLLTTEGRSGTQGVPIPNAVLYSIEHEDDSGRWKILGKIAE